eukprot:CAMPEP_0173428800 /NCGR_PEP_ID=MMETSP1357-20121228/7675_1 /TAXON_ID=77926 /ORGANISM="Hemiselmis rufescens, Strain PCC563" /LENGTH=64 /DNA_ID=CAMNT_0014392877 /DNA_START=8 /DNA_END=199 /DNA_ORIENTATION=-
MFVRSCRQFNLKMHGPDEGGLEVWDAGHAEFLDPPRRDAGTGGKCGDTARRAATRMVQGGRRVQ